MYHQSWNQEAINIFEKCIEAHGGWNAWNNFDEIRFDVRKFSGALVWAKGLGRSFLSPKFAIVDPKKKILIFNYGTHEDTYTDGSLNLANGMSVPDGKKLFSASTFEQWSPAHALYFFGYALTNYAGYPFILNQYELVSIVSKYDGFVIDINFPETMRTHSRRQRFYFNSQYLLSRHDYRANLAGPLVFGAHFTESYKAYKGLQIATVRKVRPRVGRLPLPAYGIYAELDF